MIQCHTVTEGLFKKTIWDFYKKHKRHFPWRETRDPYHILVSEIMLQQTQAARVVEKYNMFVHTFPTIQSLAHARTSDVLRIWKGLGYNRRALGLKKAAEIIEKTYDGHVPKDMDTLISLPSVGPATAGDIRAFAWNMPATVIETNIRTVFIHFFFPNKNHIHDKDIIPLIEKTLDKKRPRDWYYALMDYGAMLKHTQKNAGTRSAHYTKQSLFKGSHRQLRAQILHTIVAKPSTCAHICTMLKKDTQTVQRVLLELEKEGFIEKKKRLFSVVQ